MKILTVDDSFDWLNTHTMVLMGIFGNSAEIVSACSASEALNIYKTEYETSPFDLIITDLQMESDFEPMLAGEWLIKEILSINNKQNILIVSSSFKIDLIAKEYNVDYLSKRLIVTDMKNYINKIKEIYS